MTDDIAREQHWNARHLEPDATRPAFRVWRFGAPAIVLGVSQRAQHDAVARRLPDGVTIHVRASGGGAVLADTGFVAVSIALPPGHAGAPAAIRDSYRWLGEIHRRVLADVGVPSRLVTPDELRDTAERRRATDVDWACFGSLAPWEVVAHDGRKLCGFAQKRNRHAVLLVAGTWVVRPDWELLCAVLGRPDDAGALRRITTHVDELAGRPVDPAAFATRLEAALGDAIGAG